MSKREKRLAKLRENPHNVSFDELSTVLGDADLTPEQQSRLDYHMGLPYTILLKQDIEDGGWFAKIVELPGCMTIGESQADALEMLEDAKLTWLSGSILAGDVIPEPQPVFL